MNLTTALYQALSIQQCDANPSDNKDTTMNDNTPPKNLSHQAQPPMLHDIHMTNNSTPTESSQATVLHAVD
jgi:hypothetical protein